MKPTHHISKIKNSPVDSHEAMAKKALLERYKRNLSNSGYDTNFDNYVLIGKLSRRNIFQEENKNEFKEEKLISFTDLKISKRVVAHMDYKKISETEIMNSIKNHSQFKCICEKSLKHVYLVKHKQNKEVFITGVCCYKKIRENTENETLCLVCDIPMGKRKSKFVCDTCKKEEQRLAKERLAEEAKRIKNEEQNKFRKEAGRIKKEERIRLAEEERLAEEARKEKNESNLLKKLKKIKEENKLISLMTPEELLQENIDFYGNKYFYKGKKYNNTQIKYIPPSYLDYMLKFYSEKDLDNSDLQDLINYHNILKFKELNF